jgi:hypothetical protein
VALHHLVCDFDVDRVDIVEQAWSEQAADLQNEPGDEKEDEGALAPTAG